MVNVNLYDLFESLVMPLASPEGRAFSGIPIPDAGMHRLAKDSDGSPCLLLFEPDTKRQAPPIRLQNLSVSYGTRCVIRQAYGQQETGNFTIISCSNTDTSLYPHFLKILTPILASLGTSPSAASVRKAIVGLVSLFQTLSIPAKKSIQGLWAELLVIKLATDPVALASAWHSTKTERVDFLSANQRLEVKSNSSRQRVHHFSLAQLIPPSNTELIVASIFVESVGGGLSLRQLSDYIRAKLSAHPDLLIRFDAVFYETLGSGWSEALEECFDEQLATSSLSFFDSIYIPKIEGAIPPTVGDVRFTSDISSITPINPESLSSRGGLFSALVSLE